MSIGALKERLVPGQDGWTVPWVTIGGLAVTMAYGDGFLITTLRGATGAVERNDQPFLSWLAGSTVVLPLFVVAVWGALRFAHHHYGRAPGKARNVLKFALVVAAAASVVGIGTLA